MFVWNEEEKVFFFLKKKIEGEVVKYYSALNLLPVTDPTCITNIHNFWFQNV
jgi:hypothetical protein